MKLFHIHTYRCLHAENVPDAVYVEKAIELGAEEIWFTDHAPFPDDPIDWRMRCADLEEYLCTLSGLKRRYHNIDIHIGLETEYLPYFDRAGYYKYLRSLPDLEMLLLGQHFVEISDSPLTFSFSESEEFLTANEYRLLGQAIVQGAKTGYFDAIAHPDRIFRRCAVWDSDMEAVARAIIQTAAAMDIPLEMNLASAEDPKNYKPQFWRLVPNEAKRIVGFDAHFVGEMESRYLGVAERIQKFEEESPAEHFNSKRTDCSGA